MMPPQLPVDQPRDRPHAGGVAAPPVAVGVGQRVVAAQPPAGVLDGDAAAGAGAVVGDIRRRAGPPARLAAGCGPEAAGVGVAEADVGAVAERADAGRQAGEQARGAQHRAVGGRAAHAVGHIGDRAGHRVHRHLDREGVLLFLPAVVRIGVGAVGGALHPLLEGVDQDGEPRRIGPQGVQAEAVSPAGVGQAQRVPPRRLQQRHQPPDRPACGRLADPEAVAEDLVGRVAPQPDHGEEEPVARDQAVSPPAPRGTLSARTRQPVPRGDGEGRQHVRCQRIERAHRQPGHGPEDGGVARQVVIAQDHRGPPSAPSIAERDLL